MAETPPPEPVSAALQAAIEHHADVVRRARQQPEFLRRLGLSLPVSPEDVKQAYLEKAKQAHPDRSGDAEQFKRIQEAFDEAIRFAARNGKRLPWLGNQMPIYIAQRRVLQLVQQWGGRAELESFEWLKETVGEDFAAIADRLVEINLAGTAIGDAELRQLTSDPQGIQYLEVLRLTDTQVTDASALLLVRAANLRYLDLRGTQTTQRTRRQLAELPHMVHMEGQGGWLEWLRRFWKG